MQGSGMGPSLVGGSTEQQATGAGRFELDVRLVESGELDRVLLASTDDGCDTQKNGDC
ncbi:FxLD family lanthipeptide [Dactylosporangium sp. CA-233914]|uniref:FxLD family lanthipeptide n=1 Tax=Dactylosporangium sp. CA-233914 TaxID=3239934 RepID=UPI003D8DA3EF